MRGGGVRRDESVVISNTNVFAALGTLRKKKKPIQKDLASSSKGKSKKAEKEAEKKEVYWAPAPLTVKSWADVDDEDDEDYYATVTPPDSVWGTPKQTEPAAEENKSDEEGLDEVDDYVEEEHEDEPEIPVEAEPAAEKTYEVPSMHKEAERQLSKKELKKKELEELDAVLAEFRLTKRESDALQERRAENNGEMENSKENAPAESKNAKKKKKKDKLSKEVKKSAETELETADGGNGTDEAAGSDKAEETSSVDVKERLKKVIAAKKKKSSKEIDAAARAAASEAAIRGAKLAAAKRKEKKEKNQFNQQPVR